MYRAILSLLVGFVLNQTSAQITPDNFIGGWYAIGIHDVVVGDTLEMMNGEININDYNHYLNWVFGTDNKVSVNSCYRIKRENKNPTYISTRKHKKWKYFKENQWLYIDDLKFKVLVIDKLYLKTVCLE